MRLRPVCFTTDARGGVPHAVKVLRKPGNAEGKVEEYQDSAGNVIMVRRSGGASQGANRGGRRRT